MQIAEVEGMYGRGCPTGSQKKGCPLFGPFAFSRALLFDRCRVIDVRFIPHVSIAVVKSSQSGRILVLSHTRQLQKWEASLFVAVSDPKEAVEDVLMSLMSLSIVV